MPSSLTDTDTEKVDEGCKASSGGCSDVAGHVERLRPWAGTLWLSSAPITAREVFPIYEAPSYAQINHLNRDG